MAATESRPRGRPRDPGVDDGILQAAVDLVSEGGFDHLTIEAVAARAGVAKATIYRRFPGKADLLVAACHAFAPPMPELNETGDLHHDLVELMMSVAQMYQQSDTGRLMPAMLCSASMSTEVRDALQQFRRDRKRLSNHVLAQARERGELRDDVDSEMIGDPLVGAIAHRHLISGGSLDRPAIEALVDAVLHGVTT